MVFIVVGESVGNGVMFMVFFYCFFKNIVWDNSEKWSILKGGNCMFLIVIL